MRLGIDIGGTFTDLVALDEDGRSCRVKVPTTPSEPAKGVLHSVKQFLENYKVDPKRVKLVVHATTLASNALLTGDLPNAALITTEGFRDVLEIGRQNRPELYNLQVERIRPLIPREHRFEVRERMTYEGRVLVPIELEGVRKIARKIRQLRLASAAICFLHSYVNPAHEKATAKILRSELPQLLVSVSSELIPEFREYERTSTTVVNASLQPLFSEYLTSFIDGLAMLGVKSPLFVMQSNSGTLLASQAMQEPARIIESGPVAGAVAAKAYAAEFEAGRIVSLDVGGTTSKAGVWTGDRFDVTDEYEVGGRIHGVRKLTGSGYPVKFPYVDLLEVGTGGGSIARVDNAGVLHVGPESAGASPGPACYGGGGEKPTLTDANLVLGRLGSELIGGDLKLNAGLAEKAIQKFVAGPMKTSVREAAQGILKIATANVAGAIRAASVEKGRDPREMLLVAFGGAAPMLACEVAQQMEMRKVLVPPGAGVFSSLGLLLAEPLHDFVRTMLGPADNASPTRLNREYRSMEEKGAKLLGKEGIAPKHRLFTRFLDMRYEGQSFEIPVEVPGRSLTREAVREAVRKFHNLHESRNGYKDEANAVEIVNLRVYCRGRTGHGIPGEPADKTGPSEKPDRESYINGKWIKSCRVLGRPSGSSRGVHNGPCIIEDYDSTIIVPEGARYIVDSGSLRITM